jgi:Glycosyl transferases group 1
MSTARRLRVVELSGAFGLGGTEQAVEIRAALLPAAWFDVKAVGVFGGPRLARLVERGVDGRELGGELARLRALLVEFAPDIVHYTRSDRDCAHSKRVQALCFEARTPVVVETNVFGRPAAWPQRRAPDLTCHMSLASMLRCAVAAGRSMSELHAAGHRAVYLPVPTPDGYGVPSPPRAKARAALGVGADELLACRVARPDVRKWSTRLELALPSLFRAVPELRFAFMAAPAEKAAWLRRRFGRRVLCLEPGTSFEEVQALYAASDCMLHSSGIGESFGLAVAEGMFHGLPVIVDSTPNFDNAQVEVVLHERTGLVVRSSRGFVGATRRLADDPKLREAMARESHARAAALFADRIVVAEWLRLYADACRRANVELPAELGERLHSTPSLIADDEYPSFPGRYAAACESTFGSTPDLRELTLGRLLRGGDTLRYAQRVGPRTLLSVVRSRLRSGRWLGRD